MQCNLKQHQNDSLSTDARGALYKDASGAFADLGTFLPLVLGLIALNHFSAVGIFVGFGLFALASALLYRRPIPVQPMKVIAALVIVQQLSPAMLQASGLLMGATLLILAYSGAIDWLSKQLSPAISIGIQLAIGLQLVGIGGQMMSEQWLLGVLAFSAIFVARFFKFNYLAMPVVLIGATIWHYWGGYPISIELQQPQPWSWQWPSMQDFSSAAVLLVVPQLALTLTNAVIATSALAKDKFSQDDPNRFAAPKLAKSSGFANLLLAPLGAAPMCHGAGGLAVQHHFGARSWRAPALFGVACLLVALTWEHGAATVLSHIPLPVLGALLAIGGLQLAWSQRYLDGKPYCKLVIMVTAATSLLINAFAGLLIGVVLEFGRKQWRLHQHLQQ
ncbi:putative sulfate/molybdate transporter [Paraferrimonas haliotis]|uniref:putative sulfate/molybdate transporter n=1 Tax=Paraferrimonas haliotis TaxID=2013866 RepID=UPI000BA8D84F|nr:putative sulfate/molybdate transporter [Paraferrimonas haliotis]